MRHLALALALSLAAAPAPAAADTYLRIPPGGNYQYGTVNNLSNVTVSDDAYALMPPQAVANGNQAIGNRYFASGYKESTHGYIQNLQFGAEYHLYPFRFGVNTAAPPTGWSGADYLEGYYSTNGGSSWYAAWFGAGNRPAVTSAEVSLTPLDGANDRIYLRTFTNLTGINTWATLYSNLMCDFDWYKMNTATKITHNDGYKAGTTDRGVYVDYIFVNALVKLTVFGATVAPANATQGTDDIPLLQLTLRPFSNSTFDLNAIKANFTGTAQVADLADLSLWRDADESGTLTSGDTLMGRATVTALTNVTITGAPLVDDPPHNSKWLLCASVKPTATAGRTVLISLTDQTFLTPASALDAVASNTDRTAAGTNGNPDPNPLWPITQSTACTIRPRAALTATWTTQPPANTTMGSSFDVTLRVQNTSTYGAATEVLPTPPEVIGTGMAVTSTVQTPVTLAAGATANFTWTYTASQNGTLQLRSTANGIDQGSGKAVASTAVTSTACTIAYAAVPILQFTRFQASPAAVSSDGQNLTVEVEVTNDGNATATAVALRSIADVAWTLTPVGTATVTNVSEANAAADIAAGASQTWRFLYSATGAGSVSFQVKAQGSNTGVVTSSSNTCTVLAAANLTNTSLTVTPSPVGVNGSCTLLYTFQNSGGVTAEVVIPTLPLLEELASGDPDPVRTFGPVPASQEVAAGKTATFYWTYNTKNVNQLGQYRLSANLAYRDALSGVSRSTAIAQTAAFSVINSVTPIGVQTTTGHVRRYIGYTDDSQFVAINEAGMLYVYNVAGVLLWSYDFTANGITPAGEMFTVAGEYDANWNLLHSVILIGSNSGRVYAVKWNGVTGTGLWTAGIQNSWISLGTGSAVTTGPIAAGDSVYCAAGTRLARRLKTTGTIPTGWSDYEFPANVTTAPTVDNNYVYVGAANGRLYCLNAGTGALVSASPALGGSVVGDPVVFDGKIYTSNTTGKLIRFDSTTNLSLYTEADLDGAANSTMSDVWPSLTRDYLYLTDTGANLYQRKFADLSAQATWNRAGATLYAPIEWGGIVYFNGATASGTGTVCAVKKTDGTDLPLWPYVTPYPCRTPVTLDFWSQVVLVGRDWNAADQNTVYFFGLPTLAP